MIEIRKADFNDFLQIADIYKFYVENTTATFEEEAPDKDSLIKRWKENDPLPFIVATINKKIIGYSYAAIYKKRSAYRFTVENSIYIHPEHTGKKIGNKLLDALIKECQKQNIKQMIARIAVSQNSGASVSIHRKFGFEEKGYLTEVGYKFGNFIDTIIMQKSLKN